MSTSKVEEEPLSKTPQHKCLPSYLPANWQMCVHYLLCGWVSICASVSICKIFNLSFVYWIWLKRYVTITLLTKLKFTDLPFSGRRGWLWWFWEDCMVICMDRIWWHISGHDTYDSSNTKEWLSKHNQFDSCVSSQGYSSNFVTQLLDLQQVWKKRKNIFYLDRWYRYLQLFKKWFWT